MPNTTGERAALVQFPATLNRWVLFAACCWAPAPGFFVVEAMAQAAWTTPYSMIDNYISDLGAVGCGTVRINTYEMYVCSPLHAMVNTAYVAGGAITAVGALAGRRAWPRGRAAGTGAVLLAVSGAGTALAGFVPEDVDVNLHLLGALLAVPTSFLGMGLLARSVRRHHRGLAAYTWLTVLTGLTGLVLTGMPGSGVGTGLAERIAGYPFIIWQVVVAVLLLTAWRRANARRMQGS